VSRDIFTGIRLLALPTLALVVVVAFVPGRLELAVRVYALVACAVALGFGIAWLGRAYPATRPLREREGERPERTRPTALTQLENEVILGVGNAFDLHRRLAPRLRSLAQALLASRRGVALDSQPTRAQAILGDETWDVVRLDRPAPTARRTRGIPADVLTRVVDSLERT
jgi:hypothetical protein